MSRFVQITAARKVAEGYRRCRNSGVAPVDRLIEHMGAVLERMDERDAESGPHGHLDVLVNKAMDADLKLVSDIADEVRDMLADWNNA